MNIDLYGEEITVICPWCDGEGNEQVEGSDPNDVRLLKCHLCDREGEIQAIAKDEFEVDLEPRRLEL